jgi:serine/threonine-protein phosphatase 4 catalytic subunit
MMCDIMWSDPENIEGWKMSARGAGFIFGGDILNIFLETNGLK